MVNVSREAFESMVVDALDHLPDGLAAQMDNLVVTVEDQNPDEPTLLGLHEGIPLTERDDYGGLAMPDVITIYRLPLCGFCADEIELREQVHITVLHEVAHHFGIDDDRLTELGWD